MKNQPREELEQHGYRKSHLHTDGIKPCPLCGCRPILNCYENGASWSGMWEIECPRCELALTLHYLLDQAKPKKKDSKAFNRELAITRWNRRV